MHRSPVRVYRVAAFDDAYTRCFHEALLRSGVAVEPGEWSLRWLAAKLRRGDIVHLHWPSALYDEGSKWLRIAHLAAVLLLLRMRGVRIVWTAHNLYPHDGGRRSQAHRIVRRIVVSLASRICVHGGAAADRVCAEFGVSRDRIVILQHGNWIGYYPNDVSRHDARERLGIPQGSFFFLFIGLCRAYKNLEYLVHSHESLLDDSLLWIVGRFPSDAYYTSVTQAIGAVSKDRVTVKNGFVSDEDMQLYLNACDAVVIPYTEVLTSGSAMLALSFGRPVVAPRMGALEDLITDECGVLYDASCDGALTQAMRSVRGRRFEADSILERAGCFTWQRSAQIFSRDVVGDAAG